MVITFMLVWAYEVIFVLVRSLIFMLFIVAGVLSVIAVGLLHFGWASRWYGALQLDGRRIYRWVRWGDWTVEYSRVVEYSPHFSTWRLLERGSL